MYGPGDDESKFTTHVIKSCLANVPELKLTAGEQKRDFIYIDDVISAYMILLEKAKQQTENFQEYDLGSGKAIKIREFVEIVHKITQSCTKLNFGVLPYRENEIMQSEADITSLMSLGWLCQTSLIEGIKKIVQSDQHT
jgi:nucleoside-diphosphate-sugar epimerase